MKSGAWGNTGVFEWVLPKGQELGISYNSLEDLDLLIAVSRAECRLGTVVKVKWVIFQAGNYCGANKISAPGNL